VATCLVFGWRLRVLGQLLVMLAEARAAHCWA